MAAHASLRRTAAIVFVLLTALIASAARSIAPSPIRTVSGAASVDVDPALLTARGEVSVVVQARPDAVAAVTRAVTRLGGVVTRELPIIDGFATRISARSIPALARLAGVRVLTLDRKITVAEGDPMPSTNSVYRKVVKADVVNANGYRGAGQVVAVVDTGITEVADLANRVVEVKTSLFGDTTPCQNFSGEPGCDDSYGHGTFIAGIIAGSGASSGGKWKGVAPDAKVLSVKIAGRTGSADVSTVLAAIQWVVSAKNTYGIKVLNLSLGTNGTQTYRTDPMNYAVEKAWDAGIVVVVSASNLGPLPGTISKPADDPWVITAGATDDMGTVGLNDDTLPDFTAHGPTAADGLAKPDVVAPGGHIVSLRAPGSAIDTEFPNYIDGAYRKGSGTSMSAAVVSGTAALIMQRNPSWSPNRVKYALMATARGDASDDPMAVGSGIIDAQGAAFQAPAGVANNGLDRSSGMGSLDASRGTVQVQADDAPQTIVNGVLTLQLLLWDPVLYTALPWNTFTWATSQWAGHSWYGNSWYGNSWYGNSWYGNSWYGHSWYGNSWYGNSWYGSAWFGAWE
jgi:serine protease AprX